MKNGVTAKSNCRALHSPCLALRVRDQRALLATAEDRAWTRRGEGRNLIHLSATCLCKRPTLAARPGEETEPVAQSITCLGKRPAIAAGAGEGTETVTAISTLAACAGEGRSQWHDIVTTIQVNDERDR